MQTIEQALKTAEIYTILSIYREKVSCILSTMYLEKYWKKESYKMGIGNYQHPWDTKPDVFRSDYASKCYYRLFNLMTEELHYTEKEKLLRLIEAIGHHMMCHMAEEKDGFPTYRALGYDDEDIAEQKQKVTVRVNAVNAYVTGLGRPPLFTDPEDTYKTAWEYYELMRFYHKEAFVQKYADLTKTSQNAFWK